MSVLIKGMEMPTNCFLCPLSVLNENRLFCEVTKNEVLRAKIDAECPLVPVPPHGDLVDKQYAYQNTMAMGEHTRKIILKQIDALPIIIPAEEGE